MKNKATTIRKIGSDSYTISVYVEYNPATMGYKCNLRTYYRDNMEEGICLSVRNVSIAGLDDFATVAHTLIGENVRQQIADTVAKIGVHTL